jgi:hypothetical protein
MLPDQTQKVDITTMTVEQLYKLALGEQKNVTAFYSQLQQAQANVTLIEAEIAKRVEPEKQSA